MLPEGAGDLGEQPISGATHISALRVLNGVQTGNRAAALTITWSNRMWRVSPNVSTVTTRAFRDAERNARSSACKARVHPGSAASSVPEPASGSLPMRVLAFNMPNSTAQDSATKRVGRQYFKNA